MKSTILVEELDERITADMLYGLFRAHGSVEGVDLVEGQDFGFVRMSNEVAAKTAIAALNGHPCAGSTLNLRIAHKQTGQEFKKNKGQPEDLCGQ